MSYESAEAKYLDENENEIIIENYKPTKEELTEIEYQLYLAE